MTPADGKPPARTCICDHGKDQHRGGTYWCRVGTCMCSRYRPDLWPTKGRAS